LASNGSMRLPFEPNPRRRGAPWQSSIERAGT